MFVRALAKLKVREKRDSDQFVVMQKGQIGSTIQAGATLESIAVDGLVELAVVSTEVRGWVRVKDNNGNFVLETVDAAPLNQFELSDFILSCVDAEIEFNKSVDDKTKFFVVADFLIAWADIESGIKNKAGDDKDPTKDRLGPFQISAEDWQRFLESPSGKDCGPADRLDGLKQPFGAAFLALEAMSAISTGVGLSDPVVGPYVPSYVDVLLAMMLGTKAAVEIRKAKIADNGTATVDAVLGPDDLKKLIDFRGTVEKNWSIDAAETVNFLKDANTVDDLLSNSESLLNSEFQTAYALIEAKDPEDLPKFDGTTPPWMTVARAQFEEWKQSLKSETTPLGRARVVEYFKGIKNDANGTEPWCAAFIAYCLKKCDPPIPATVPKSAGWAPNWLNWGNVSVPPGQLKIPEGAIVTISPGGDTKNISHVGFCDSSDSNQVKLLGGNQSDTLKIDPFARSRIAAIRWLTLDDANGGRGLGSSVRKPAEVGGGPSRDPGGALGELIARGEGNYKSFNRGLAGDSQGQEIDFSTLSVQQVMDRQKLPKTNRQRLFAVGKYQIVPKTMKGGVKALKISSTDMLTPSLQETLFRRFLVGSKRPQVRAFIASGDNSQLRAAQIALANEFASVGLPDTGISAFAGTGNNKASITPEDVARALSLEHLAYMSSLANGKSPDEAWIALSPGLV